MTSRPLLSAPRKNWSLQVGPIGLPSRSTTSVGLPSIVILSERWFSSGVVSATCSGPERRRQAGGDEQDEDDPGGERDLVAAQPARRQPPGTEPRSLGWIAGQLLGGVER